MLKKIKDVLKKSQFVVNIRNDITLLPEYRKDIVMFHKYWIGAKNTDTKCEYTIQLHVHSIEKGMTSLKPRPFGVEKIHDIMYCLRNIKQTKSYEYSLGVACLEEYCKFYEKNKWCGRKEYKETKEYLNKCKKADSKQKVGVYTVERSDFLRGTKFDFSTFVSTRHSVRNYSEKKIAIGDVKKAAKAALYAPTACNRQMCKIYYVNNEKLKKETIKYGHGLTNFDLDTCNIFVVTFDVSSYCCTGDRHQGYLNSGLVAMNFVNALHSLGIGSCFVQFGNSYKEEEKLKNILNIPKSEKVAVMLSAGYYDKKSIIPCSSRKDIEDILCIK